VSEETGGGSGNAIQAIGLRKEYRDGGRAVKILDKLSLNVPAGDWVAIMGPPRSGKSTLLNLLGGIDRPDAGEIQIGFTRIDRMSEAALKQWRGANVGIVYQSYDLLPTLRVAQNVELPLMLTPLTALQRRHRVDAILRHMGLSDVAHRRPSELSGVHQQRICIARALAGDPKVLLCDEPTSDLDRGSADGILSVLQGLNRKMGKTIVMVTRDESAGRFANRVLQLNSGRFAGLDAR
jgi:putative ABC transport system ATP-binding protein